MDPLLPDLTEEVYSARQVIQYISVPGSSASSPRFFYFGSSVIAKRCEPSDFDDYLAAINVASNLGIRCPSVRRAVIDSDQQNDYIIMDRIQGNTLDVIWTKLSWWESFKLALQLHFAVKSLRSRICYTLGSLVTGKCRSFWLGDQLGLRSNATRAELSHFFRYWIGFAQTKRLPCQGLSSNLCKGIPRGSRFVFTHHNLTPRNLLVSNSGQLWLLGWDLAGYYPESFEYAAMYNFDIPKDWGYLARFRWFLFTVISAGYYEADARFLQFVRSVLTRHMS